MTDNKDYQKRVLDERSKLAYKVNKLDYFIHSNEIFNKLPGIESILLKEQLNVMKEYINILDKRIKLFN